MLSVLECHGWAGLLEGRTVMVPIVGSTNVAGSLSGIEWLVAVEEDVLVAAAVPFSAFILTAVVAVLTGPCVLLEPLPVVLDLGTFFVDVLDSFVDLVGVGTGKFCVKGSGRGSGSGGMVCATVGCVAFAIVLAASVGITGTAGTTALVLPTGALDEDATRSRSDRGNGCTEEMRFFCAGATVAVPKVAVTDDPEGRFALAVCVVCCDSRSHCAISFVPDCKLKTLLTAAAVSRRDNGPAGPGTSAFAGGLVIVWYDGFTATLGCGMGAAALVVLLLTGSGKARTVDPTVLLVLLAAAAEGLFGHTVDAVVAVPVPVAVAVAVVLATGTVGREEGTPAVVKALMEYFVALLLGLVTLLAVVGGFAVVAAGAGAEGATVRLSVVMPVTFVRLLLLSSASLNLRRLPSSLFASAPTSIESTRAVTDPKEGVPLPAKCFITLTSSSSVGAVVGLEDTGRSFHKTSR